MKSHVGTCRAILLRNGMGILSIMFYKNIPNLYHPNLVVATRKWSNTIYLRDFLSVKRLKNELGFWKTASVTRFYWDGIS